MKKIKMILTEVGQKLLADKSGLYRKKLLEQLLSYDRQLKVPQYPVSERATLQALSGAIKHARKIILQEG